MGKGGGSGGGKPDKSTVSHGNEASGAQTIHASERRWTALSCLTGHDHPFSLWIPSCYVMGYKAKGKWEALGDGACRRRYGRPERERSYKTSLFLLWLMLHPIPPPPYRGTGFRYRIRLLPCLACGILPDGTIPWR